MKDDRATFAGAAQSASYSPINARNFLRIDASSAAVTRPFGTALRRRQSRLLT